jgi:hypothetical protein
MYEKEGGTRKKMVKEIARRKKEKCVQLGIY